MVLVVVLIAVVFFFLRPSLGFGAKHMGSSAAQGTDDGVVTVTETAPTSSDSDKPTRETSVSLPSGLTYVSSGIYTDGPTTSEFAEVVAEDYWNAANDLEGTVSLYSYSPKTGKWYDMTCRGNGSWTHCAGGNNANVYITEDSR